VLTPVIKRSEDSDTDRAVSVGGRETAWTCGV